MSQQHNNKWLISLDTIDSTNNYAMRLVQDGMAQNGLVVTANYQTNGKGQRGNQWLSGGGDNLAMSMILSNEVMFDVYHLSFCIPVAVADVLQGLLPNCQVDIKWTNDIFVLDKKICGILIENIFRGANITWSVVGIGINVNQFIPKEDKWQIQPISMFEILGKTLNIKDIIGAIRSRIMNLIHLPTKELKLMYEFKLWKKGKYHKFQNVSDKSIFSAKILEVTNLFQLRLLNDEEKELLFNYGEIKWLQN